MKIKITFKGFVACQVFPNLYRKMKTFTYVVTASGLIDAINHLISYCFLKYIDLAAIIKVDIVG